MLVQASIVALQQERDSLTEQLKGTSPEQARQLEELDVQLQAALDSVATADRVQLSQKVRQWRAISSSVAPSSVFTSYLQARITELESALEKSNNMSVVLNSKWTDAENRVTKAQQAVVELERKLANIFEETALHRSQTASVSAMMLEVEGKLQQSEQLYAQSLEELEEQKRKVCEVLCAFQCHVHNTVCVVQSGELVRDLQNLASSNVTLSTTVKDLETQLAETTESLTKTEEKCTEALKRVSPHVSNTLGVVLSHVSLLHWLTVCDLSRTHQSSSSPDAKQPRASDQRLGVAVNSTAGTVY